MERRIYPPSTATPAGAAGGDLSGSFPNPGVAKVNGQPLGSAALHPATDFDAAGAAAAAQSQAIAINLALGLGV